MTLVKTGFTKACLSRVAVDPGPTVEGEADEDDQEGADGGHGIATPRAT